MANPFTAIVAGVMRLGPAGFRERYAPEIVRAMNDALEHERAKSGRLAMARLGVRGIVDAVRVVGLERRLAADPGGRGPLADWRGDVRYIARSWRRAPAFSLTVFGTLILGIGFAAAIFSFADGYLFRQLPFPAAERLFTVRDPNAQIGAALKAAETLALRSSAVADFGFVEWGIGGISGDLIIDGQRVNVLPFEVTQGFRDTLELPLARGRDFTPADHVEVEATLPVWLSHRFWQREFGGSEDVLGRMYRVTGRQAPHEIRVVGILGPQVASFDVNNEPPDVVVPKRGQPRVGPNSLSFPVVRIPAGLTPDQATARIASALQSIAPSSDGRPRTVRLRSLREYQVAGGRPTARVFFAGAMLVLLLVTINLVHLLLTRGVSRGAEISTRLALGASHRRIVRLFLTESLMLAAAGIAGGLILGWWLSGLIRANVPMMPSSFRNLSLVPMSFDVRVIVFAATAGLLIAVLGGLWPARRALRRSLSGSSRHFAAIVPVRLSRTILASELAVATVVLVGACFIGVGIWRYLHPEFGFDINDRYTVGAYRNDDQPITPLEAAALHERLRLVPGVAAAGAFYPQPAGALDVPGVALSPQAAASAAVTRGYAEAWSLRRVAGRWFEPHEFRPNADVAVVEESFARLAWPDRDPLGQPVRVGGIVRQVVGVTTPRRWRLDDLNTPRVFVPADAVPEDASIVLWAPGGAGNDLHARVTDAVRETLPGADVRVEPVTLEDLFRREIGEPKFQAPIIAAFGVLSFILAGVGIFGLVSYLVAHRLREFGIRIALGARPAHIWHGVVRESVVPAVIGLAIGIPAALALETVVQSAVFGWRSSGAIALGTVVMSLLAVAIVAAIPPARRAMRVDPVQVLRAE